MATTTTTTATATRKTAGILYKRSEHVKRWRRRYFELNEETNEITYHLLPDTDDIKAGMEALVNGGQAPRGSILLSGNALKHCKISDKFTGSSSSSSFKDGKQKFAFEVRYYSDTGSSSPTLNVVYLAATSEADRNRWMHAISRTNKDTLPMLIDQQQLEDDDVVTAGDIPKEVLVPIEDDTGISDGDIIEAEEKERERCDLLVTASVDTAEAPTVVMPSSSITERNKDAIFIDNRAAPQSNELEPLSSSSLLLAKDVVQPPPQSQPATAVDEAEDRTSNDTCNAATNDSNLYTGLSDDLKKEIDRNMQHFLQLCDEPSESWDYWFEKRGVTVMRREMPLGGSSAGDGPSAMVRAEVTVPHSPLQIFNALTCLDKKRTYEKHLVRAERLNCLNKHTFQDFLRYEGTWPTTPREMFCTCHWRILPERNNAIAMIGFSAEDNELCPMHSNAIRAEVRLSGYLIVPIGKDGMSCEFKRISALDMKGGLPFAAQRLVEKSTAMWPSKVSRFLSEFEPEPEDYFRGDVTNENAYGIFAAPSIGESSVSQCRMIDSSGSDRDFEETEKKFDPLVPVMLLTSVLLTPSLVWGLSKFALGIVVDSRLLSSCLLIIVGSAIVSVAKRKKKRILAPIQFVSTIAAILVPHLVWHFARSSTVPYWEYCFLLSVLNAIRAMILFFLGAPVKHATNGAHVGYSAHNHLGTGPVTCRFTVELKNMLQFVSEKKRESIQRRNNAETNYDISGKDMDYLSG